MHFNVEFIGQAGRGKITYKETVSALPYSSFTSNGMKKEEYYADLEARVRKQCNEIEQVAASLAGVEGVNMRGHAEITQRYYRLAEDIPGFARVLDKLFADFNTWTFYVDLSVHEGYNTVSDLGELLIWLVENNKAIGEAAERIVNAMDEDALDELDKDGKDTPNVLWDWYRALWHQNLDELAAL